MSATDTRFIRENLHRQKMALGVLMKLLEEEFTLLKASDPQAVTGVELTIQELLRQIAAERVEVKAMVARVFPGEGGLRAFAKTLPPEQGMELLKLYKAIDFGEQMIARQADKNRGLALALFDQSKGMLDFLRDKITPKKRTDAYSANGRYARPAANQGARILRGAL